MINHQLLSGAQIIEFNPILEELSSIKCSYLKLLLDFIDWSGCDNSVWTKAEKNFYFELLGDELCGSFDWKIDWKKYSMYFFTDLAAVIGYNHDIWLSASLDDKLKYLCITEDQRYFFASLRQALAGYFSDSDSCSCAFLRWQRNKQFNHWRWLKRQKLYVPMAEYLSKVEENFRFMYQKPFRILVTATMSAGKSTFINALVGRKVAKSQNLACTSKIHTIISKLYDDDCVYKDDGDLVLNAKDSELLQDNSLNLTNYLATSVYFNGDLSGMRLVINDSPGVNASDHSEHKSIAEDALKSNDYDLLIYVMNATQLFTNDDNLHVDFVKEHSNGAKILFVVNKIDMIEPEVENPLDIIERVRSYLLSKNFSQPLAICPLSSLAGLLVKRSFRQSFNRSEERQLYTFADKFDKMNLEQYYQKFFPQIQFDRRFFPQNQFGNSLSEAERLLKTSGLAYVERLIRDLILFS